MQGTLFFEFSSLILLNVRNSENSSKLVTENTGEQLLKSAGLIERYLPFEILLILILV